MLNIDPVILNLAVALGIGLLIGGERERRKGGGPSRSPAGIRTFAVTSLAGAVSFTVGGNVVLGVTIAGVIALTAVGYLRAHEDDPGLTTEIALILTALLGGLSMQQPALAAGVAVAVAILLAARTPLHHFVRAVLTEGEVKDALIFAGATLVVLPLVPDRPMGPYGALNPHTIWIIVILVMAISAAGYVTVRLLGARFGLPIAGLTVRVHLEHRHHRCHGCSGHKGAGGSSSSSGGCGPVVGCYDCSVSRCSYCHQRDYASSAVWALLCAGLAAAAHGTVFTIRALR